MLGAKSMVPFGIFRHIALGKADLRHSENLILKVFSSQFAAVKVLFTPLLGHNALAEKLLVKHYSSCDCPSSKKPCPDKPACPPPKMPTGCPSACPANPKCNPTSIANLEGKIGVGKFHHPTYFWPNGRPLLKWSFIYPYKEVVTLILIFAVDLVFLAWFLLRIWCTRNDWMFTGHIYPYEKWDLRKPTIMKILTYNQPYRPMPFLQGILEDIRKCEAKRKPKASSGGH